MTPWNILDCGSFGLHPLVRLCAEQGLQVTRVHHSLSAAPGSRSLKANGAVDPVLPSPSQQQAEALASAYWAQSAGDFRGHRGEGTRGYTAAHLPREQRRHRDGAVTSHCVCLTGLSCNATGLGGRGDTAAQLRMEAT